MVKTLLVGLHKRLNGLFSFPFFLQRSKEGRAVEAHDQLDPSGNKTKRLGKPKSGLQKMPGHRFSCI